MVFKLYFKISDTKQVFTTVSSKAYVAIPWGASRVLMSSLLPVTVSDGWWWSGRRTNQFLGANDAEVLVHEAVE